MSGRIDVIGAIWQPGLGTCAYSYNLSAYDVENMRGEDGKIARRDIERWLALNAGDFQTVDDFTAEINSARYGWKNAESECVYLDAMYGDEE